jgi:hypothetical protein
MKWYVTVNGNASELTWLMEQFKGHDWWIDKADSEYRLFGRTLEALNTVAEVRAVAADWLALANGASRLKWDTSAFSLGNIVRRDPDGKLHHYMQALGGGYRIRLQPATLSYSDAEGNFVTPVSDMVTWTKLAETETAVHRVLELYGKNECDWVNLYRIYEVIRADCGGEHALINRKWVAKDEIKLFTRTANSPDVTGLDSRHGVSNNHPPRSPMQLKTARQLIKTLTTVWINSK